MSHLEDCHLYNVRNKLNQYCGFGIMWVFICQIRTGKKNKKRGGGGGGALLLAITSRNRSNQPFDSGLSSMIGKLLLLSAFILPVFLNQLAGGMCKKAANNTIVVRSAVHSNLMSMKSVTMSSISLIHKSAVGGRKGGEREG